MKEHFNRMHLNVKARENISSESKNKEEEVGILPSVEKNGDDVSNNSNDIKVRGRKISLLK